MPRWAVIFLVIAVAAMLFAFSGKDHENMHLGLYISIICLILALGTFLLSRRSSHQRKP